MDFFCEKILQKTIDCFLYLCDNICSCITIIVCYFHTNCFCVFHSLYFQYYFSQREGNGLKIERKDWGENRVWMRRRLYGSHPQILSCEYGMCRVFSIEPNGLQRNITLASIFVSLFCYVHTYQFY
jgi:hypothetical protein